MSNRARFGLIALFMVCAAAAFAVRSFQNELESIRKRQMPGASQCNEIVAKGRTLIETAQRLATEHPCRAELVQAEAIDVIDGARKICGRYYDKAPLATSDAAVERMDTLRRDLHAACQAEGEDGSAGDSSSTPSVK